MCKSKKKYIYNKFLVPSCGLKKAASSKTAPKEKTQVGLSYFKKRLK